MKPLSDIISTGDDSDVVMLGDVKKEFEACKKNT